MSFIILSSWVVTWWCQTVTVALRHLRRDWYCRFWFCSGRCQLLTPTQTEAAGAFWMKWRVTTEAELLTNTVRHISEGFAPSPSVSFLHQHEVSSSLVCVEKRSSHCDEKDLLVHIKVSTESPCYMWKRQNVNTREKSLMAPIIFSFFSHSSQRES